MASNIRTLLESIAYIVVTFLATVILVVETPATGGYFNLGEAAIYSVAVVASSSIVAGIAGGVGPALADVVLGYAYFAPATLLIKFTEGYLVSYMIRGLRRTRGRLFWADASAFVLGLALALVVGLGLAGFSGGAGLALAWTSTSLLGLSISVPSVGVTLPSQVWIIIAVFVAALGITPIAVSRHKPYLLPMALGGLVMVTGYFLYEYFISNPLILSRAPAGAFFEIPVNVGQAVAGILLSYPVVQFVERARPGG